MLRIFGRTWGLGVRGAVGGEDGGEYTIKVLESPLELCTRHRARRV